MQPSKQNKSERIRINGWIKASRVKVINENGDFLGEMETWVAIKLAQEQNLDLVEINGRVHPVLTQIIDFGKFKYLQKKEQAEAKKKQKIQGLKELSFHAVTETNDLTRLVEQAKSFLADNNKVLFSVRFRGREIAHPEVARDKMLWIIEQLKPVASEYTNPSLEGKTMSIMLTPAKSSKTA